MQLDLFPNPKTKRGATEKKPGVKLKKYDSGVRQAKIVGVERAGWKGVEVNVTYIFKSKKQAEEVIKQFLIENTMTEFCLNLDEQP